MYDTRALTPVLPRVKAASVGRKKLYPERITLPLTRELLDEVDGARGQEPRVDFIRQAVERELARNSLNPSIAERIDAVLLPGESREAFYKLAAAKELERRGPPEPREFVQSMRDEPQARELAPFMQALDFLIEAGAKEILFREATLPARKRRDPMKQDKE